MFSVPDLQTGHGHRLCRATLRSAASGGNSEGVRRHTFLVVPMCLLHKTRPGAFETGCRFRRAPVRPRREDARKDERLSLLPHLDKIEDEEEVEHCMMAMIVALSSPVPGPWRYCPA